MDRPTRPTDRRRAGSDPIGVLAARSGVGASCWWPERSRAPTISAGSAAAEAAAHVVAHTEVLRPKPAEPEPISLV
jgi:hypothetical protein